MDILTIDRKEATGNTGLHLGRCWSPHLMLMVLCQFDGFVMVVDIGG